MKKIIFFLLLLLVVTAAAQPQEPAQAPAQPRYEDLLKKLTSGDTTIDFTALRLAYADSKDYDPYGPDNTLTKKMFAAWQEKNYKKSVEEANNVLKEYYVSINAHYILSLAYSELKNTEKAAFHKKIVDGLIESILQSGDGKSMETAYTVISTKEEYVILNVMGLQSRGQALLRDKGHSYDKLEGVDPKTNKTVSVYFQIDLIFGRMSKILGK